MQSRSVFLALGIFCLSTPLLKADPINPLNPLGSASTFAVLSASTVTNTGTSTLNGNVGVSPGTSITGFPPGVVTNGAIDVNNGAAILAQSDALTAYNYFAGLSSTSNLTGEDLGGLTLTAGVYTFSSSAQLTGPLTLDFQGLSNVNIVFQIGTTLTTASASQVDLLNAGNNDNVFWDVGSSATLGTTSAFLGTIIANQSITLTTGATLECGSALALNGAVTLDTNTISTCPVSDTTLPSNGDGPTGVSAVPEPGTFGLLATGCLGLAGALRRKRCRS